MPHLKKINDLIIIGYSKDLRTDTFIIYAQISINGYLKLVGKDFDKFDIQRKRETYKGYIRLKKDIKDGALIPPITLALEPSLVKKYLPLLRTQQSQKLQDNLINSNSIYILDGLQRTHIMNDLLEEGVTFIENQKLLLEFWFEEDIGNLIYRLIVLNSGQKPMSMRHQIELLFLTMQEKLKTDIPGLEMYNEREKKIRDGAKKFPFERIVTGYHCFLNETPEIDKSKIILDKLDTGKVITDQELIILERYSDYTKYLLEYIKIDAEAYRIYEKYKEFSSAKNWLSDENVVNAFFAAVGLLSEIPEFEKRIGISIKKLIEDLKKAKVGDDPLFLKDFDEIRQKFNPKQFNVGFITRRTIMNCFLEYFRNEGMLSFKKCWFLSNQSQ
jgi:hypothetical protein